MTKDIVKNIVIGLLVIIIIVLTVFILINKQESKEIIGTVVGIGEGYVLVSDNLKDYAVNTKLNGYNLGDEVKVTMKKYKEKVEPVVVKIAEIEVLEHFTNEEKKTITSNSKDVNNKMEEKTILDNNSISDYNTNLYEVTYDDSDLNDANLNNNNNNNNNIEKAETKQSIINKDEVVLKYVNEVKNFNGDSLKSGFITIVDFLFYGGEIKGVTFSEVANKTKLEVLKVALMLDNRISEYFPEYKENITSTSKRAYNKVKEKAIEKYIDITTKVCQNDASVCEIAKKDFSDMKKSFGLTWSFLKDLFKSRVSNLKELYEIWSGK